VTNLSSEPTVTVRRQWNDHNIATYRLVDLSGLHMSNVSGGVGVRANRSYLCGYVACDAALEGAVSHSCAHGEGPHTIKVCVVKKDNSPAVYQLLMRRLRWETKLRHYRFVVDLGDPAPEVAGVHRWLAEHCDPDDYVEVAHGWWKSDARLGQQRAPRGPQVWFAHEPAATAFAKCFKARSLHSQNEEKRLAAAHWMCSQDQQ
jgi:hypothetical protein